jgi:nitrogen fixation protein NifU and related proteins
MSRIQQLYEEMILDHNKKPRNFCVMENHTHSSHGKNPLCGDDYYVYINCKNSIIDDISFIGQGCAISKSSGSLMSETLKGKSIEEALELKDHFIDMVSKDITPEQKTALGKLKVFAGVKEFPIRVKCAALVWRALEDALDAQQGETSTE